MTTKTADVKEQKFEAEIQQLLDLLTHSLYSNPEIFLRELLSNASDALDKLRFLSVSNPDLIKDNKDLNINLKIDKKNSQIIITDSGIGMNEEELKENIGTIARSGSKQFLKNTDKDKDKNLELIGQFGVGFYSIFMVADKVTLKTRKAGESASWVWTSNGKGTYSIEKTESGNRGTQISLHIKDDAKEFLEDWKVRSIVRKFSDYVSYDIIMPKIDTRSEKEKEEDTKAGKIFKAEDEVINSGTPIWRRPKNEIKDEQYQEFYKHISHDHEAPLKHIHFSQEGVISFTSLLFLPGRAPFDLHSNQDSRGVQLFVKKVFIMDDCKELVPQYLRFIKGIVDTEDLPLNVSREILQHNQVVIKIQKNLVKKVIDMLKQMSKKKKDDYKKFWEEFGSVFKEGIYFDFENKDKIAGVCWFKSSTTDDSSWTSLEDYISRMKKEQKDIYYITAESIDQAKASPHLEIFAKQGIEVLYLTDPVDEWVTNSLTEFDGKKLISVTKGELDLGDMNKDEKSKAEKASKEIKEVTEKFRSVLQDKVKSVRTSSRLTDSPCCLVSEDGEMSANMERILKMSQQEGDFNSKKILEVNPTHPVIKNLQKMINDKSDNSDIQDWVFLLYDQSLLAQGSKVTDPKKFNERFNKLLLKA